MFNGALLRISWWNHVFFTKGFTIPHHIDPQNLLFFFHGFLYSLAQENEVTIDWLLDIPWYSEFPEKSNPKMVSRCDTATSKRLSSPECSWDALMTFRFALTSDGYCYCFHQCLVHQTTCITFVRWVTSLPFISAEHYISWWTIIPMDRPTGSKEIP